jgi:hypothetical protein
MDAVCARVFQNEVMVVSERPPVLVENAGQFAPISGPLYRHVLERDLHARHMPCSLGRSLRHYSSCIFHFAFPRVGLFDGAYGIEERLHGSGAALMLFSGLI